MKRAIFSILIFTLFLSCGQKSVKTEGKELVDTYSRIEENFLDVKDTVYIHTFDSATNIQGQIIFGAVSVTKEKNDLIKIENFHNDGYLSEDITFLIDKHLKIKSATYNLTTDNLDGSTSEFSVENPLLTFNFNPYSKGLKGLQGRYSFIIKTVWEPGKILGSEGHKPKTTYRTFHGKFKNGL